MTKALARSTYDKLISDISRLYEETQTTLTRAKARFAWETGRRIVLYHQDGQVRAPHNTGLLKQLSVDLTRRLGDGFSVDSLQLMRRFYLAYPKYETSRNLPWSSYAQLVKVTDPRKRELLERRIEKDGLSNREVRKLVCTPLPAKPLPPLKRPADLKLNTFCRSALNVKLPDGAVLVDCGFFVNRVMTKAELADVELTDTPSYTYAATVDRVIDGDTLKVIIDVGFNNRVYDKLRLRGINTPELGSPEGEKAKRYVAGLLPPGSCVVLKSHKSGVDKYGRFVIDLFYKDSCKTVPKPRGDQQGARAEGLSSIKGCDDPLEVIASGVYLNQQLLDEGMALRMEA